MSTALEKVQPPAPLARLAQIIDVRRDKLRAIAPRGVDFARFRQSILLAATRNPAIADCDPASVVLAISTAARLGLDPSGALGMAYLVPYGRTCTLVLGYRGLLELARRSGEIVSVTARAVHEGDRFDVRFGSEESIAHIPGDDPGPLTHAYAIVRLRGGGQQIEVMSRAQIEAIRDRSRAGRSGPWVDHFDEMAKKSALRRVLKLCPMAPDLLDVLGLEDRAEAGETLADPSEAPAAESAQLAAHDEREAVRAQLEAAASNKDLRKLASASTRLKLHGEYERARMRLDAANAEPSAEDAAQADAANEVAP